MHRKKVSASINSPQIRGSSIKTETRPAEGSNAEGHGKPQKSGSHPPDDTRRVAGGSKNHRKTESQEPGLV